MKTGQKFASVAMLLWGAVLPLGADPGAPGMLAVTGALSTHDPTIAKVTNYYVRVASGRGIPIATSPDLLTWTTAGQVFATNPAWTSQQIPGSTDLWAPDLVLRDGQWRLYYAVSTFGSNRSAIGLAVNSHLDPVHPEQGWEDLGSVFETFPTSDVNAIDPQIASDGKRDWLVFGSFWSGIRLVPLDASGKVLAGEVPQPLAQRPDPPDAIEGAFLYRHGEWYYLFVSFDFCCKGLQSTYNIRVGRSKNLTGPYTDREGIAMLRGGGTLVKAKGSRDIGPGHNSILVDGTREYLVYHVYDVQIAGTSRLRIQELTWDAQGWPVAP